MPITPDQSEGQTPLVRRRIDSMMGDPKIQGAVGGIIASGTIEGVLENLIYPERIAALLAFEDAVGREKYEEVLALHQLNQRVQGDDLSHESCAGLAPGEKAERLRKVSQLESGVNRAITEAEIRLRYKGITPYPDYLDEDVWEVAEQERQGFKPDDGLPRLREGRRISYTEAVRFAREMNAQRFYNNYYYPSITRDERRVRVEVTRETLFAALMEYNAAYSDQPGGVITLESLLDGINGMLVRNAENDESCYWHNRVKKLVQQMMDQRTTEQEK